jgi:hypothetical protein
VTVQRIVAVIVQISQTHHAHQRRHMLSHTIIALTHACACAHAHAHGYTHVALLVLMRTSGIRWSSS